MISNVHVLVRISNIRYGKIITFVIFNFAPHKIIRTVSLLNSRQQSLNDSQRIIYPHLNFSNACRLPTVIANTTTQIFHKIFYSPFRHSLLIIHSNYFVKVFRRHLDKKEKRNLSKHTSEDKFSMKHL